MKPVLFMSMLCMLLLGGTAAFAQQAAVKTSETQSGNITLQNSTGKTINAYYTLAPAYPHNIVLQIRPSESFDLSASIVNAKGKEMMTIKQETVTGRYANSIDISKLSPGDYFIQLKYGVSNDQVYKIPFKK